MSVEYEEKQSCGCVIVIRERSIRPPLYYIKGQSEGITESPFVKGVNLVALLLRDFCPHRKRGTLDGARKRGIGEGGGQTMGGERKDQRGAQKGGATWIETER